jgi:hypothetical protein
MRNTLEGTEGSGVEYEQEHEYEKPETHYL